MSPSPEVTLPPLTGPASASWTGLVELANEVPHHWCLIGGAMVMLHCVERGVVLTRPTDDGDAVVDVRARPRMLEEFTAALMRIGFVADGITPDEHQHRWTRGQASIDVLIPEGVGERASIRRGAGGATTLQTPGSSQALRRAEPVIVNHGGNTGTIMRPSTLGALVLKAAAMDVSSGIARDRHLYDFCTLATLTSRRSFTDLARKDRQRLNRMLDRLDRRPDVAASIEGASEGIARIRLALERQGMESSRELQIALEE